MPITISVDVTQGVQYAVMSGDVNDHELVDAFRAAIAERGFDPSLNGVIDLRGVERLDISSRGIWQLADALRAVDSLGRGRRVAIVASTDFQFGMARMASTLLTTAESATHYEAFRSMAGARAWLGLAPAD